MENFLITIYEKIPVSDNIILFKKKKIVKNAVINFKDDFEEATFYDENNQKVKVENMLNPYTVISDDKYCYNYPLTLSDIESMYPNAKSIEELIKIYDNEINNVIEISYYDSSEDKVIIMTTNEEILRKVDSDILFNDFSVEYDSSCEATITIKKSDIKKINDMLEKKQYKKLKENFSYFNESLDDGLEQIMSIFEKRKESIPEVKEENKEKENNLDEILDLLNNLIGLNNIKIEVNKLVKYLLYREKTKKYLKLEQPNLHMFFTGNPGTGKTTVARIIGKLLYELGYIKNNKFAEITPKDLIAEYVGQTAIKTSNFIKENKGGVIFIDEAYVFASEHQGFSEEALVEILKELEKNETVFIFAGYKDEMKKFMELNPGLTSRIGYYLEYQDYTEEELYQIFEYKVSNMGFKIDDKLKDKIISNLKIAKLEKNFGNGRYIDKLINKIILEHAINTEKYKRKKELISLKEKDFTSYIEENLMYKTKVKKIGY